MFAALLCYHILLLAGLSTMLIDGGSGVAFVVYSLGMPLGALAVWIYQGRRLNTLDFAPYPEARKHIITGFIVAGVIPVGIWGIMRGVGWASDVQRAASWTSLITAVVLPQLFVASMEELAFRGVTQSLLETRFGSTRGLFAAAGLFGIFHLPNVLYQDVPLSLIPLTLGTLTLMGVIFGHAYQRSGNRLLLPVVLHYAWNIAAFGVVHLLSYETTGPRGIVGVTAWFPESGLLGTLGLVLLGLVVALLHPAQPLKHPIRSNTQNPSGSPRVDY